jgi:hypothetical protein
VLLPNKEINMKLRAALSAGFILCAGLAYAQTAQPTEAPVKIGLKLAPGITRGFKITVDEKGTMTLPGSGQNMPMNMGMTAYAKLFVDKANDDGTWAARYRIGGIKMEMNGAPLNMPNSSSSQSITIKGIIAKNGSFLLTEVLDGGSSAMGMGMSPGQMMNNVLGNLMNLPDKPVNVGDTWQTVIPLPFDSTHKSQLTVDSKIVGVDHLNGDQFVRIQHDSSGPLNMSISTPVTMNMTGTVKGSGVTKVSVNTGTPVDDRSTQHLTISLSGTNPSGNGEQMNMSIDMNVDSHIEAMVLDKVVPESKKPAKASKKAKAQ